ncbi:MAG: hypothetical protein QOD69_3534 [Solirubrobacteraceae bacterium]|nr:hypothetical protein [Solirubrobacteraceae bacterium]
MFSDSLRGSWSFSHARRVVFIVLCALVGFPAAAAAAKFPLSIAAPAGGTPSVLAAGDGGASIVVWATNPVFDGYGPLTVDTIKAGPAPARRRWSTSRSLLAGVARDRAGDLDLLTMLSSPARGSDAPRLVLYRARQNGGVRRVWSAGASRQATIARRGKRLAIAWIQTVAGHGTGPVRFVLQFVTSPDGRSFTRPRAVEHVLPSWLGDQGAGFVTDLALTLDAGGSPVVALTASRRRAPTLVLASLTPSGRVRARELTPGVDGLVDAHTTAGGRVAVIVEDTGIEGEDGECVSDHQPRQIWGTVREPHADHFGPVVVLDSGPYSCADSAAQLVTNAGERPAVLWGSAAAAPQTPPTVKLAIAELGKPLGPPATIASGALLRTATYHDGGMLFAVTTRPTDTTNPHGGPLVLQAITSGSGVGPLEPVDAAGAQVVLSDTTDNGTDSLIAWQPTGSRDLHMTGFGGQ